MGVPRRSRPARAQLVVAVSIVGLALGWVVLVLIGAGPLDTVPDVRGSLGFW